MVFEVRFNPQGIIDTWLGSFTLEETKLDTFILEQTSRRIIDEFSQNEALAGKFRISACEGTLESGIVEFTVDIAREVLQMSELLHGRAWHRQVLELCMQKITHVLYAYDFEDYDSIKVFNKFDNKSMNIEKKEINEWRKRRIEID